MSQIGTLVTGAGVATVISGQGQCEQFILIGTVGTTNPLQGLSVEIDGKAFINIANSAALLTAFMKWQMESLMVDDIVGIMLKISTGVIPRNTTYRFTNAGITTPAIFAFSEAANGIPFMASTLGINASSNQKFDKFSALFLDTPANIDSADVVFRDGHKAKMTAVELNGYFAFNNQAESAGELGGVTVIDNTNQMIQSVQIYTNAGAGGCVVLTAKLPDDSFQILKAASQR